MMTPEQLSLYYKSNIFPDGISLADFALVARLIRKGSYLWGTSRRIYFPKPGDKSGKLRPITIPVFMDRVVQKAIDMILQAIYEPIMEKMNVSFGFRPNKGCHDAITAILSYKSNGMGYAIEGDRDIKAAYDTVNKQILLNLLRRRIKDNKFISLIEDRLNYVYVEKDGTRVRPETGIPQGGIDSPYLFNIYMMELDVFVQTKVKEYVDKLNNRLLTYDREKKTFYYVRKINPLYSKNRKQMSKIKKHMSKTEDKRTKYEYAKQIRRLQRYNRVIGSSSRNSKEIRYLYTRYADDWIFLTNGDRQIAEKIKNMIKDFLADQLKLELSEQKTLITDITKAPAKFLGFEIRGKSRTRISRKESKIKKFRPTIKKWNVSYSSGLTLWCAPDKERLINRFYMKGFCDEVGFPRELPWLSTMEAHCIVERYKSVIEGISNYYLGFIRNNKFLGRWIYILRYSCIKTLAQKYKTTIKGIFKKYGVNHGSVQKKTISIRVVQKIKNKQYFKDWQLPTYFDITRKARYDERQEELSKIYWEIERNGFVEKGYPLRKGSIPRITNEDYLETISWVSWRTQAAFELPCASCGTMDGVQMHHLKHIRKQAYVFIGYNKDNYKKILSLRNRKQIPLCQKCLIDVVHSGKYQGPSLVRMCPTERTTDNRIIHIESFVKPGVEYESKTLEQKGWREYTQVKQKR